MTLNDNNEKYSDEWVKMVITPKSKSDYSKCNCTDCNNIVTEESIIESFTKFHQNFSINDPKLAEVVMLCGMVFCYKCFSSLIFEDDE